MEDKKKITLPEFLAGDKIKKIILIAGFLGIALIFLSTFVNFDSGQSRQDTSAASVSAYHETMQNEIESIVESIEGVGEAKVLMTIENSVEYVYLENSSNTKTKEIEPIIRGVVVVCDGGDNPVTVQRVLSAVTKALNISTAKVCVTKLSK